MPERLDLRPGHRPWQNLPAIAEEPDWQSQLQYALETETPVVALPGQGTLLDLVAAWLGPKDWVIYIDTTRRATGDGWYNWLRDELGLKVYRITAEAANDIRPYLEQNPNVRLLLVNQVADDTAETLDVEEIFFHAKELSPDLICMADISYSLGLMPFYMTGWQVDVTVYRRPQLGYYLAADDSLLPPALPTVEPNAAFLPYLKAVEDRGLPTLWNHVHEEAQDFRKFLRSIGGVLTARYYGDVITGFRLPARDADELQAELAEANQARIGVAEDLHRKRHCLVQHAPDALGQLEGLKAYLAAHHNPS
jgi:aspartate aminotransferase-like enzyme